MSNTTNNIPKNEKETKLDEEGNGNDSSKRTDASSKPLSLTVTSQKIILNVFHNLIKTYQQSTAVKKTSDLTNIDIPSISKLIERGIQSKKLQPISVSPTIAAVIENAISELRAPGKCPSIKTIGQLVRKKLPEINASPSTLRLWMKKLGYKYAIVPQKFSSKQEIRNFLTVHNLKFEQSYTRKELLAVVAKHRYKSKRYILYKVN